MLLFADIGNSSVKIYKENGELQAFSYNNKNKIEEYISINKPDTVIVSSVFSKGLELLKSVLSSVNFLILDYRAGFSFIIDIENPETAGIDRLLQIEAALASGIKPGFIIIGTGSAVTIDLVSAERGSPVFKGGLIIPGEHLQYKSMISNTDIKGSGTSDIYNGLIGRNTSEAVTGGIRNCLYYGVKGIISELVSDYSINSIAVTGRGSKFITDKNRFFLGIKLPDIIFDENLIYSGFVSIAKKMNLM